MMVFGGMINHTGELKVFTNASTVIGVTVKLISLLLSENSKNRHF